MRPALAAAACVVLGLSAPAAGAVVDEPPQRTFSASTAGTPAALAVGDWKDEAPGAGRLEVDFASAVAPLETSFLATWVSGPVQLSAGPHGQTVASALAADHIGNNATDTAYRMKVEYRTRQIGGQWSPWRTASDSSYTRPARQPQARLFYVEARTVSACACAHQAQFRVSGAKSGVDASRLTVLVAAGSG